MRAANTVFVVRVAEQPLFEKQLEALEARGTLPPTHTLSAVEFDIPAGTRSST